MEGNKSLQLMCFFKFGINPYVFFAVIVLQSVSSPPPKKGVAVLFLGNNKGFYTFTIWESIQGN